MGLIQTSLDRSSNFNGEVPLRGESEVLNCILLSVSLRVNPLRSSTETTEASDSHYSIM